MDEASLAELADSIREQGVVQPILVRPVDAGGFEIIAGERRWRAAQRAGLREVPVQVKAASDQAALALALIENIQREDLNPLDEAHGLARLIAEFGLTHEAAAKAVGRSRSAVTNLLRLTQLAQPVQDMLLGNQIEMGHARALLALPAARQTGAAAKRPMNESVQIASKGCGGANVMMSCRVVAMGNDILAAYQWLSARGVSHRSSTVISQRIPAPRQVSIT